MRAVIYARYSSDLQREASIEDQVRLCKERVAQLGGEVIDIYSDAAISGSRLQNRPGIQTLLAKARIRPRAFDVLVAEALDRLSRDQEDIAGLFKRLTHADIRILTLSEGEVNELHVGLKGTMNALFLKDLGAKVRRGQRGRVEAGRAGGGLSFGYRKVPLNAVGAVEDGLRAIDPNQAAIVLRIFKDYDAGLSPKAIAAALNREHIPAPRGGEWNASTINGHPQRLNGILLNRLYAGEIVFGRHAYKKNPETGAREIRAVAPADRVVKSVPDLRIVPHELWDRVQERRNAFTGRHPHVHRRPKHLLSGLVRCGVCGGPYSIASTDRLACVAKREKGTCNNAHTIRFVDLENRVLGGLKERLLLPDMFAEYARTYRTELNVCEKGRMLGATKIAAP